MNIERLVAIPQTEFMQAAAVLVPGIIRSGAVIEGEVVFSSGIISPFKIEADYITKDSELFPQACMFMHAWVLRHQKTPDIFVGVVRGGSPYAQYLAQAFDKGFVARLGKNDPEKAKYEIGNIEQGKSVLIIDDILTLGTNIGYCAKNINGQNRILGALTIYTHELIPKGVIQSLVGWSALRQGLLENPEKREFVARVDEWQIRNRRGLYVPNK